MFVFTTMDILENALVHVMVRVRVIVLRLALVYTSVSRTAICANSGTW